MLATVILTAQTMEVAQVPCCGLVLGAGVGAGVCVVVGG